MQLRVSIWLLAALLSIVASFFPLVGTGLWESAPEDPKWFSDVRDIPEIENYMVPGNGKLKTAAEPEIIIEKVRNENGQTGKQELVLSLPNIPQILLVAAIIILFIIYRSRQARANRSHRR